MSKSKIKSTISIQKGLPNIWADAQQVEQVLVNLLFNAMEAMPHGGKLTVRAGVRRMEIAGAEGEAKKTREYVVVSLKDSGHGIEPGDLDKIFRPFYTAKKVKGIGLGLSICESIMKGHGGRITVESSPGKGTSFCLFFPADRRIRRRDGISPAVSRA